MTDREKAIVMAHTGICMLKGEKIGVFYQYLDELYNGPVYTHECGTLDIKEKSKPDFLQLCKEEEPEPKKGKWIYYDPNGFKCSECGGYLEIEVGDIKMKFCPNCGSYNGGKEDE